MYISLTMLAES